MSLSKEAIQKILGIKEKVYLEPKEMAKHLTVSFLPSNISLSPILDRFIKKLKRSLIHWGVKIVPYEKILTKTNRIKEGVVVFTPPIEGDYLPINYVTSFTSNQIITIIEKPPFIKNHISFDKHIEIAMKLFAWHMSNLIISVDKESWRIYNFNASFPTYKYDENFDKNILYGLISKIATPIRPLRLSEFIIKRKKRLEIDKEILEDFVEGSILLGRTGLFPSLIEIDKLRFRNYLHKLIASQYLDKRSGLSYGFLARQLPIKLPLLISLDKIKKDINFKNDYFVKKGKIFIVLKINRKKFCMCVPRIWVFTTRSGCKKTELIPERDLCKIGLFNGQLIMEVPENIDYLSDYKPSFDTRVILAHAIANVIFGAVLKYFRPDNPFSQRLEENGMAIVHWHGYIRNKFIPVGYWEYGRDNPAVSCSSPQTAIYAFRGKHRAVEESLSKGIEYLGDIHVEPQHGVNVTWDSIRNLAFFLLSDSRISKLGEMQ